MWQMVSKPNEFVHYSDDLPPNPGRRRRLLEEAGEPGGSPFPPGRTLLSAPADDAGGSLSRRGRVLLHGDMGTTGAEQYMGGRLLGGGTSINGEQDVWPTARLLTTLAATVGDPAWGPTPVYDLLRQLETFAGTSSQPRGTSGPLNVRQAPTNPTSDGRANDFVAALSAVFGPNGSAPGFDVATVQDYNDPATPLSIFTQWQLTQQPGGARASASTALLTPAVRARPNLVIATRATAMRVLFDAEVEGAKPVVRGVEYTQSGAGKVAYARREVIVCAGHRSSLLLETSGVGDPAIIGPLLAAVGRRVVAPLPGVGKGLMNDGIVLVALNATGASAGGFAPDDLYGGGAFLPWPNAASAPTAGGPSARFTQFIGAPALYDAAYGGTPTFGVGALLLNTTSKGEAHIQSADPLYEPLVRVATFNTEADQANWLYAVKDQLWPVVQAMEVAGYKLLAPESTVLDGSDADATLDWVFATHTPSHHWTGTCSMGLDPAAGAVVDSAGRVHGVTGLRVADASIYPLKLDGNTGIPAYIAGGTIARKILAGS